MRKMILMLLALPQAAFAWGGTGHRMIGELAVRDFSREIPAFLRTPQAAGQVGLLAQEPDISRNAGQPHDGDSDPGHFIDVSDDGTILGGPKLSALPPSRRDYDTALRAVGAEEYKAGFLPYNIMDGYQQLVKDFALLRMNDAAAKFAAKFHYTPAVKKRFADAQGVRRLLTLRDLGVWAHYVGDASQPLHASIHYNGWGDGPNPQGFATAPGLHAKFESAFVDANISQADVAARLAPPASCGCAIQAFTSDYLRATAAQVTTTYELDKAGAFDAPTPRSRMFAATRIAAGAAALRDLAVMAWAESATATLGYRHKESIADIEAGRADPAELD